MNAERHWRKGHILSMGGAHSVVTGFGEQAGLMLPQAKIDSGAGIKAAFISCVREYDLIYAHRGRVTEPKEGIADDGRHGGRLTQGKIQSIQSEPTRQIRTCKALRRGK